MYTDDGLHAKLAPLMDTAAELTSDLAHMGATGGVVSSLPASIHLAFESGGGDGGRDCPRRPAQPTPPAHHPSSLQAGKLLEAASREYYIVHKPRIFPRQRYKCAGCG